jgi:hypothetical protein
LTINRHVRLASRTGPCWLRTSIAIRPADSPRIASLTRSVSVRVASFDIIIDEDDIFGDGVNIAARVENECEPGGVYLPKPLQIYTREKAARVGLTEPAFCHDRESRKLVSPPIPRQIPRKKAEKATRGKSTDYVAEREGFEPPIGLHLCRISSAVHSTTLPPLQAIDYTGNTSVDGNSEIGFCYPFATQCL